MPPMKEPAVKREIPLPVCRDACHKIMGIGPVSISVTLAMAFGSLVLVVGLSLLLILWDANETNTFNLINRSIKQLSHQLENDLNNHVEPLQTHLHGVAHSLQQGRLSFTAPHHLQAVFRNTLDWEPELHGLFAWSMQSGLVGMVRDESGQIRPILRSSEDADMERAAITKALQSKKPYWDEISLFRGLSFIHYTIKVEKEGKLLGILSFSISIPEISRMVAGIGKAVGGSGFLLRGEDAVLGHQQRLSQPSANLTIPIGNIKDPVLPNLWAGKDPPEEVIPTEAGLIVKFIEANEDEYLAVMRKVEGYGPKPWYIGAWFPADEIGGASVERLFLSGLIGLFILVFGVWIAAILGKRIARPIRNSAVAQAQISQLEVEHVQELPNSFFKELNDQANAFNTMLGALRAFERYVPRKLVADLMQKKMQMDGLSETRDLTVMFTDLAGFTTLSENLSAQEVATFLNEHFDLLGVAVERQGGTIDKYIGDALMAFWGAPEPLEDAPKRACRAALDIAAKWQRHNAERTEQNLPPIGLRIGLHHGPCVVGNIGFPGRMNYTIVGDTVNSGQRLESLGKEVAPDAQVVILISESIRSQLDESFTTTEMGACPVKGRQRPIAVYRLLPQTHGE
uniref:Putative Adenylate and Guanylate cyclase catalytic domain protein n=1 Tax=Magnetococcus massalia (strain MO-1) TaxID=451514 RepID=A0A1S7LKR8_MAGMO|nr:putative Adenylate and Guanylate cyclase catalytic domain protein [Candidatus Magnetococcus massalia]